MVTTEENLLKILRKLANEVITWRIGPASQVEGFDPVNKVLIEVDRVLGIAGEFGEAPQRAWTSTHDWHSPSFMNGIECCRVCGIVRRRDDQNKPCKGPPKITLRDRIRSSHND